jgi:hypothetical protein
VKEVPVTDLLMIVLQLIPLDALPSQPTPTPPSAVYPRGSQGFAAYIIGGFMGLGLLVLAMALLNRRPKRRSTPPDQ